MFEGAGQSRPRIEGGREGGREGRREGCVFREEKEELGGTALVYTGQGIFVTTCRLRAEWPFLSLREGPRP